MEFAGGEMEFVEGKWLVGLMGLEQQKFGSVQMGSEIGVIHYQEVFAEFDLLL